MNISGKNEIMTFDVIIIGAGPAGLATACRLKQLTFEKNISLDICVVEKGTEIGSHIISGAVIDTKSLDELFPDWSNNNAPIKIKVNNEIYSFLVGPKNSFKIPKLLLPKTMSNKGNYIISLGELCKWLAKKAENLGVHIFTGFSAAHVIYEANIVKGIRIGSKGLSIDGQKKKSFTNQIDLLAKFSIFCEGSHGHLGKELIKKFNLSDNSSPQHYAIGFKEIWEKPINKANLGDIIHTVGWPLTSNIGGGGFLYHSAENLIVVGLTIDLNYSNPNLRPYDEFQRYKQHKLIRFHLKNAKRIAYGARSITKGGYYALPKMSFPGGIIIGCNAGTLNMAKLKGVHTAIKSGMLAAEATIDALENDLQEPIKFSTLFDKSWLHSELFTARNMGAILHKYGNLVGGILSKIEQGYLCKKLFISVKDNIVDNKTLKSIDKSKPIYYPKYDGQYSFDIMSSLLLSNITHDHDQPCHLILQDKNIPINNNLPLYNEPAQRYCSAGVYEVIDTNDGKKLKINAQNCIHCKVCDIKDPSQNITWFVPEGGSGPNYENM